MGSNLIQRLQHEIPPVHIDMRDMKFTGIQNQIIVQQDIQIQRPGTPADDPLPVCLFFDLMETIQQFQWRQNRLHLQHAIEKVILLHTAIGTGDDKV